MHWTDSRCISRYETPPRMQSQEPCHRCRKLRGLLLPSEPLECENALAVDHGASVGGGGWRLAILKTEGF